LKQFSLREKISRRNNLTMEKINATLDPIRNHSELDPMMMKESLIKKMREKGLKLTPQRLAIVDVLVEKNLLHPSARVIYDTAKRKTKGLSLSTVYFTLNELSRRGIIKMLEFDKMENRYEGNLTDHINLVCKECHRITDYMIPVVIDSREIAKKTRFWVTDTRLEYYGYCQKCREKLSRRSTKST
jgi:Fe2+ or Zn2+ uptake regulation protein